MVGCQTHPRVDQPLHELQSDAVGLSKGGTHLKFDDVLSLCFAQSFDVYDFDSYLSLQRFCFLYIGTELLTNLSSSNNMITFYRNREQYDVSLKLTPFHFRFVTKVENLVFLQVQQLISPDVGSPHQATGPAGAPV